MSDKHLIEQIGHVLKKSRGEPAKFIELIVCIRELNQEGNIASCSKLVRKLWAQEWRHAENKVNFEKVKWDLLCKRRRAINNRVFKSHLCFLFFIELTPEKQFVLIEDPDKIYGKRIEELERNLAKAASDRLKEKIKASIFQVKNRFADLKKEKPSAHGTPWKWISAGVMVLLIAAVLLSMVRTFYFAPPQSEEGIRQDRFSSFSPTAAIPIAVLPFDNMTGDPQQDYFSIGITEEIITALSKLPDMNVIDRNSAFLFKSKAVDLQQIREKLGARYVLQGSIRQTRKRVRIAAQLSDTATGHNLWADRWDKDMNDIFAVADDITMKIVTELVVRLTAGEHARLFSNSTRNLKAFTNVITAYHYFFENSIDDTLRARQMCEKAIATDADYVAAYALMADTYLREAEQGGGKPQAELVDRAFKIIQTALELDPSDALVHNILSRVYTFQGRLDLALTEAKKSVDIYPNSVECINWQGLVLMRLGKPEEAIKLFNRSLSLNPQNPSLSLIFLGLAYTDMKQYEKAIFYLEKFLSLKPKAVLESLHLAALYVTVDRTDEARAIVQKELSKDPTLTVDKVLHRIKRDKESSGSQQWLADQLFKAGLPR